MKHPTQTEKFWLVGLTVLTWLVIYFTWDAETVQLLQTQFVELSKDMETLVDWFRDAF